MAKRIRSPSLTVAFRVFSSIPFSLRRIFLLRSIVLESILEFSSPVIMAISKTLSISFANSIFASSVLSTIPGVTMIFLPCYSEEILMASSIPSRLPLKLSSKIILPLTSLLQSLCSTPLSFLTFEPISLRLIPIFFAIRIARAIL